MIRNYTYNFSQLPEQCEQLPLFYFLTVEDLSKA